MSNDAKGIFGTLAMMALVVSVIAGWFMVFYSAPTRVTCSFWTAVYWLCVSGALFTMAGEGNPRAGYRWLVSNKDRWS
jgi:hypothetical protein